MAVVPGGCTYTPDAPVTLAFPDFPENPAVVHLGQSVTIGVSTQNAAGAGCAPLKTTPASVTFKVSGITVKAPDMLCK